jgi:hypothetical protein
MINEEQVGKFLEVVMAKLSHQLSGWTKDLNKKEECFAIWIGCVFVNENKEYAQFM